MIFPVNRTLFNGNASSLKILISFLFFCLPGFILFSDTMTLAWRYSTGGKIRSAPVTAEDGSVYVTSEDRYLYSVDHNGRREWRTWLGDKPSDCLGTGYDGTIYVGLESGAVAAYNKNGSLIWKRKLNGVPLCDPVFHTDGTLFVATTRVRNDHLRTDTSKKKRSDAGPSDKDEHQQEELKNRESENAAVLYALSHTGFIRWTVGFDEIISGGLSISGDTVYVPTADGRIYCVSRWSTIEAIYRCEGVPGKPVLGPLPEADHARKSARIRMSKQSTGRALYFLTDRGFLFSIDESGTERWSLSLENYSITCTRPLVARDTIFVMLEGSKVLSVKPSGEVEGVQQINWEVETDNEDETTEEQMSAAFRRERQDNNGPIQCTVDSAGTLYCVTESDRSASPAAQEDIRFGKPVLSPEGDLYVAGGDWILYAFTTDSVGVEKERSIATENPIVETIMDSSDRLETRYETNMDYLYLKNLVTSLNREYKEMFIREVEERVENGTLGASEPYIRFLLSLIAGEGTITPYYDRSRQAFRIPDIQYRAITLLGMIGTYRTAHLFDVLLTYEYDESIQGALIDACGILRVDPEGKIADRLLSVIKKDAALRHNERVALNTVTTCKAISDYRGFTGETISRILLTIFKSNYSRSTREKALNLLQKTEKNSGETSG